MGPGPNERGPWGVKWALGPSGPWAQVGAGPKWALGTSGSGPKWVRAQVSLDPSGPRAQVGPGKGILSENGLPLGAFEALLPGTEGRTAGRVVRTG